MYGSEFFSLENTAIASVFYIAWFLLGIFVGRNTAGRRFTVKPAKRSRKDDEGGLIEMYVGNLAYEVGEKDLLKEFEAFGRVVSARIIKNRFNGKSKGFGFIEMSDRAASTAAIRALNGKDIKGRRVVVNEAKSPSRA